MQITGSVPIKVASKVFGKTEMWIRKGMEEKWLDIGVCESGNRRNTYYISPMKLYMLTGYEWCGEATLDETHKTIKEIADSVKALNELVTSKNTKTLLERW